MEEEKKTDIGEFTLPGGYVKDGRVYDVVTLHGITGFEEDMLVSKKLQASKRVEAVIARCITELEATDGSTITDKEEIRNAVSEMTLTDQTYLVVALRIVSIGNIYGFQTRCPECGHNVVTAVDLNKFLEEAKSMTDKSKRIGYEATLQSGAVVVWDVLNRKRERELSRMMRGDDNAMSSALLLRVKTVDGKAASLDSVRTLSMKDRSMLREEFEKHEGSFDTAMIVDCTNPDCGVQFDSALDLGQVGFFFPERTRKMIPE